MAYLTIIVLSFKDGLIFDANCVSEGVIEVVKVALVVEDNEEI